MIKVLRQGMSPGERKFQVICRNCQSEMEFKAAEAEYSNEENESWTVNCPLCDSQVVGYRKDITSAPEKYIWPVFGKE